MRLCKACEVEKDDQAFEQFRKVCRDCRNKGRRKSRSNSIAAEITFTGNDAIATVTGNRVTSLDELLIACKVDTSFYNIISHTVNTWEQNSTANGLITLYQVKATLQRKTLEAVAFPVIQPINLTVERSSRNHQERTKKQLSTALIIPDSQNQIIRNTVTGEINTAHDQRCWEIAIDIAREYQPDSIVLLGDMLDLAEWSDKFITSPEMRSTTQLTINDLGLTLGRLREAVPGAKIVYLEGNHEKRLEKAVQTNLAAAYGLTQANSNSPPALSIPYLLGLESLNIEYISGYPDSDYWINDALVCTHGNKVKSSGGETARAILRDSNYRSVIYGHIHRQESIWQTVSDRHGSRQVFAGSPGCICKLTGEVPSNSRVNNWQQGLMMIQYDNGSFFNVEQISISDGLALYRGRVYGK